MSALRLALLCFVGTLAGCDCAGLGLDQKRFACREDADCLEGSVCINRGSGLECVRRDAAMGGGSAAGGGSTAGGGAGGAGGGVAGGAAGGEAGGAAGGDAGGVAGGDAGGVAGGDAGGAAGGDAGGSTAGGVATGGGSTAGGAATAGGVGGSTAGGAATGGGVGGSSAGGAAGGSGVGPPTQLVFTTPSRSQAVLTCSFSITVETRDALGRPSPVSLPTTILLSAGGAMGVTLHGSNMCTSTPTTTAIIAPGSSSTTFYARGTTATNAMLTASANGLTSAVQALTFVDGPDSLVFTTTPPSPLRAGACFALSYQTRKGGVAMPVTSNVTVNFASNPTGSVRLYSDAACSAPTAGQVLISGSSTDTVFVRVLTGSAPVTLLAQAALLTPATLVATALPMVRRGTCSFDPQAWTLIDGGVDAGLIDGGPVTDLFASCPLSPNPISREATMMLFQATSAGAYQDGLVRCRLPVGGGLTCARRAGVASANVQWQVVEIPSGMRVVHVTNSACPAALTLPNVVDPARTFLLRSVSNTSLSYDDEDSPVVSLTGPTTVTLSTPGCEGIELQAVEWEGVTVARGSLDGGMDAGSALGSLLGLTPASLQRAVLAQSGTAVDGTMRTCSMMARSFTPGPSEVRFSRGLGDGGCATEVADFIASERLDFGSLATVQERTLTFLPGQTTQSPTITSVDTTRTFVFASNQSAMGQGMGETDSPVTSIPAEAAFTLELPATPTATTMTVRRARSSSTAVVTIYIVQVE